MIKWNFPSYKGGQTRGFSDGGIETFGSKELKSLIREVCQNSLDASFDNKEVRIEFQRYFEPVKDMPGFEEYKNILIKCKNYWDKSGSKKAKDFLNNSIDNISKIRHHVLRISDFNTTGLKDPYKDSFEGWNSLTKIDGGSSKDGDSAGSFGIGKNAPFCYSHYRTVFYRTLNLEGEKACQGMSRLLTYPIDENDTFNKTTGIGYYGEDECNMPVENIDNLHHLFGRTEVGTDIFIYGFTISDSEWIKMMAIEVLENFLVAIFNGKLSIKIQDVEINKNTLGLTIEKYKSDLKHSYFNYLALTDDNRENVMKQFNGIGELDLKFIISKNDKMDQQVLIVRSSGMKLFRLKRIAKQINFSAILELKGVQLNSFFREMENPAHDKWETGRHSNSNLAKKYYEELKEFVHKTIWEYGEYTTEEELDVDGLSDIFLDDLEDNGINDQEKESLNNHLGIIEIETKNVTKDESTRGLFFGEQGKQNTKTRNTKGVITDKEGQKAIRTLKGTRKRKSVKKHSGIVDLNGEDIVLEPIGGGESINIEYIRIIHLKDVNYKLIFELPKYVKKGYIEIVAIGENGRSNLIRVVEAFNLLNNKVLNVEDGRIYFEDMFALNRQNIRFSVIDTIPFAMEVRIYENN